MNLEKKETVYGTNIILNDKDKYLSISLEGNLDLYWTIRYKEEVEGNVKVFEVTKEDYNLYMLFDELYSDIEEINLYLNISEKVKEQFKKHNMAHYNELFNLEEKTITWYSDETNNLVANYLVIKKKEASFSLEFYTQEHIHGYDRDGHSKYYTTIRFRNSGSQYNPFNILFMKMYHSMGELKDTYEKDGTEKKLVRNRT